MNTKYPIYNINEINMYLLKTRMNQINFIGQVNHTKNKNDKNKNKNDKCNFDKKNSIMNKKTFKNTT